MQTHDVFRINGPRVIYENIDGEVVLINLDKGIYYSTDEVGANVWSLIESGRSAREIHEGIRAAYDGDPVQISAGVSAFLSELRNEELIVIAGAASTNGTAVDAPAASAGGGRPRFQPPVLNKYNDMKDMLLLDPIHDVEESGWPAPKTT